MKTSTNEQGFAAIWVAITLLFLMASTALAVDVAGFYETARTDQVTADLACLAGVPHLPEAAATARAAAAENVQRNFPTLAAATSTTVGSTLTLTDGSGNTAVITTPVGSDSAKMQVVITETDPATFGRAIGASQVPVTQQAFCKVFSGGGGDVPFGALPGGWAGGLQAPNPCGQHSGNCGPLVIPRNDVNPGNWLIKNISDGADRDLHPWLGAIAGAVDCDNVGSGGTCSIVSTDTGVSAAHLGQGFVDRFANDPGRTCTMVVGGQNLNCDSPAQVLGSDPTSLFTAMGSQPGWWEPSLFGPWTAANTSAHYYWDDVIEKCDSPRLASMPIISENMAWDIGDPPPTWPSGKKDVKIVGRYNVLITHPNQASDFHGNGNLKQAASFIMWYGPNARCVGPDGSTTPYSPGGIKTYRLVDANA